MKKSLQISMPLIALVFSSAALLVSLTGRRVSSQEIARAAEKAQEKREAEIVQEYAPLLTKTYQDMQLSEFDENPETVEELLAPLVILFTEMNQ